MKNKILKKILGIAGYKLIEKEIIKNERLISSKSYLKIDKLLDTLFKDKKINNIIHQYLLITGSSKFIVFSNPF